jgi:cellulose synthase operon protein YhjQ
MPAILFSSPKGGVGKTTIAAHVAAILARRGHQVVALDLDPQNALRLHFGEAITDEAGFMCDLRPGSEWRASLVETRYGVDLLPYGATEPFDVVRLNAALTANPALIKAPMHDILRDPDTILIVDSPPGSSPAVASVAGLADLVVVVLLADAGSACLMPDLMSGRAFGSGTIGARTSRRALIVINQVDLDRPLSAAVLESATRVFGSKLLGAVCRDDTLAEELAQARMQTECTGGSGIADLARIADEIERRVRPASSASAYPALAEWGLA